MSIVELAAGMIDKLPQIFHLFYITGFIFMAWVFGNFAVKYLNKRMSHIVRYGLSFAVGFIIVFCASAMNNAFIFVSGGFLDMLQANLFINGIIATIIISLGLHLVSGKSKEKPLDKVIKELESKTGRMKKLLEEHKIRLINEDEAKKKATDLVPGYNVKSVTLREERWDVLMENLEEKKANVFIDPYNGSYEIAKDEVFFHNNTSGILGIIIILGIVIFSLFNFSGFPQSDMQSMFADMGILQEDVKMLLQEKDMEEGCISAISIMAIYGMKMDELEFSESDEAREMIENITGEDVRMMYKAPYGGKDYIMAIALPNDVDQSDQQEVAAKTNVCVATEDKFCDCLK